MGACVTGMGLGWVIGACVTGMGFGVVMGACVAAMGLGAIGCGWTMGMCDGWIVGA